MVKVFTVNKQGKIVLTKEELEKALNEAWYSGYYNNHCYDYWWSSPTIKTGSFSVSTAVSKSLENVPSETVSINVGDV